MHAHAQEGFGNLYFSQGVILWMNLFCILIDSIRKHKSTPSQTHQTKELGKTSTR